MTRSALPKKNAFLFAALSLTVGVLAHFFMSGFVRNHLPDASWLCFGIFLFYGIWGHFKKSHYPFALALVWEVCEVWLHGRTFDPLDIVIYVLIYGCFIWLGRVKK